MDLEQSLELAAAHLDAGRLDEAETLCRDILDMERDAYALYFSGRVHQLRGQHELALPRLSEACEMEPEAHELWLALGVTLDALGQPEAAIDALRRAADLEPNSPGILAAMGDALLRAGNSAQAAQAFRQAALLPALPAGFYLHCGNALASIGESASAVAAYCRVIQLDPENAAAQSNLGYVLMKQGHLGEAASAYARAIALSATDARPAPNLATMYSNLGTVRGDQGMLDEALTCYDRGMAANPQDASIHSNRAYFVHFHPDFDSAAILREQLLWDQRHARPLAIHIRPHANDPSPDRRLRIGYVSPDFNGHVLGRYVLPLLQHHDRNAFEIFCYSDTTAPDGATQLMRGAAHAWRQTAGLPDAELARQIREDRIDILVDLTMHMAASRLLAFARKPAPVQVTFLAYPSTTGLSTMDYRLTDPYLDPPGRFDAFYSEQSVRLPDYFGCYDPRTMGTDSIAVGPLPARTNGFITFGCLNNFCKVNDRLLGLWARVLNAVPGSRLILHARLGDHRGRTASKLAALGFAPDRLEFVGSQPKRQYLETHHRIDIGLDTFPYNGHTTSLDAMAMGVPVVTLVGNTAVGRAGFSQWCNLGMPELAADSADQFVRIATGLAADLERLENLRDGLRGRMLASPLTDVPRFTRNLERAYRQMWHTWCSGPGGAADRHAPTIGHSTALNQGLQQPALSQGEWVIRGSSLTALGRIEDGLRWFEDTAPPNAEPFPPYEHLGPVAASNATITLSDDPFDRCLKVHPYWLQTIDGMGFPRLQPPSMTLALQEKLHRGMDALREGRHADAIEVFAASATNAATLGGAPAWMFLLLNGLAHYLDDAIAPARAVVEQALTRVPDDPPTLYLMALIDLREHRIPAAVSRFARALELNPALGHSWAALALIYALAGKDALAETAARNAGRLGAELPSGLVGLALMQATYRLGKPVEGPLIFTSLISDGQTRIDALFARLPPIDSAQFTHPRHDLPIVFISCDQVYCLEHALTLIWSIHRSKSRCAVHLHVINPEPRLTAILKRVKEQIAPLPLHISSESMPSSFDASRTVYYSCVRFCRMYQLLRCNANPIVLIDADALVRQPMEQIPGLNDARIDVGVCRLKYEPLWQEIAAGIVLVKPTPPARAFLADVCAFILDNMFHHGGRWLLDQVALCVSYEKHIARAGFMTLSHAQYLDLSHRPDSSMWVVTVNKTADDAYNAYKAALMAKYGHVLNPD